VVLDAELGRSRRGEAGDTVALFSNGAFGRLHGRLLTALGERAAG
jgi:hypothetical protein